MFCNLEISNTMPSHLERIIRIYNRLRRGPVTIEIISKWAKQAGINVSDRQLYRDLDKLKNIQIADGETVVELVNEKNKKTWKLEYNEGSEKLSDYDINSFFLLKNFAPSAVLEERRSSIEKFERIIYKNLSQNRFQKFIEANELYMRKTNYYENLYGKEEQNQIEDIIWGLHNHRVITMMEDEVDPGNFINSNNFFPLRFFPLELVFHRGRVHVAGCSETGAFLIFGIDKQLRFALTNETFNRKVFLENYNKEFEKLFGISKPAIPKVYNIKLEITQNYGEALKSFMWHSSQRWEKLKNGNYLLHLNCSIGRELLGFVAMGLDKIKVHRPKVLRELVMKKLYDTVDIYEKNIPIEEERASKGY